MAEKTMEDLIADRQATDVAIATKALDGLTRLIAVLDRKALQTAMEDLAAIRADLPPSYISYVNLPAYAHQLSIARQTAEADIEVAKRVIGGAPDVPTPTNPAAGYESPLPVAADSPPPGQPSS